MPRLLSSIITRSAATTAGVFSSIIHYFRETEEWKDARELEFWNLRSFRVGWLFSIRSRFFSLSIIKAKRWFLKAKISSLARPTLISTFIYVAFYVGRRTRKKGQAWFIRNWALIAHRSWRIRTMSVIRHFKPDPGCRLRFQQIATLRFATFKSCSATCLRILHID